MLLEQVRDGLGVGVALLGTGAGTGTDTGTGPDRTTVRAEEGA